MEPLYEVSATKQDTDNEKVTGEVPVSKWGSAGF